MNATLSNVVAGLSLQEKLDLIEGIWASLGDTADEIEMLASHELELQKREQRFASGQSNFCDWEEAKEHIFSKVRK